MLHRACIIRESVQSTGLSSANADLIEGGQRPQTSYLAAIGQCS